MADPAKTQLLGAASTAEVKRLVKNWRALLDLMPQMILLIRDDLVIQYANQQANTLLGDLCGKRCQDVLCQVTVCHICPVHGDFVAPGKGGKVVTSLIGGMDVEFSVIPFHGYSGDMLRMVLLHDVSKLRQQEKELKAFNTDMEGILRAKIAELKESEVVRRKLALESNVLKRKMKGAIHDDGMIGSSRAILGVRDMIYQVADSDANILISGESGTGKELVADALQAHSSRSDKTFLKVNCGAIDENLLESDLFGYEKGSFTGAMAQKKGKFEIVDGGTIFLDEIGDISPRMQASLLRILQSGELIRVGGTKAIKIDVRVIAATNVDLVKAVQEKKFRLDLYYRLNTIQITIPPLRERKEDILELASYFVKRYQKAFDKEIDFLPTRIIDKLLSHDWPGNVRELENVIQRAVLMSKNRVILDKDLSFDASAQRSDCSLFDAMSSSLKGRSLKELVGQFENEIVTRLLEENNGNVAQVAADLGIGKTALYDKIRRFRGAAK